MAHRPSRRRALKQIALAGAREPGVLPIGAACSNNRCHVQLLKGTWTNAGN